MDPTPSDSLWVRTTAEFLWILLAVFGGIARYLDMYLRTGVFPRLGFLLAHTVISGFSGYMTAQVVLRFQPEWALVAAGIGGYLGTQALDWVAMVLRDRFGGRYYHYEERKNNNE